MAGKKKTSERQKAHYKAYAAEGRAAKNRKARLTRHLKKFPNDEQAQQALNGPLNYRRKKPVSRPWKSKPLQRFAAMLSRVGLSGDLALQMERDKHKSTLESQSKGDL